MIRPDSIAAAILRNRLFGRDRPRMLTYAVTFTCNARCVFCDSWRKTSAGDLELPEIERIFRDLPRLDIVRLTGGEPFVRPDFPEIVRLAAVHLDPGVLHITTNGFLTGKIVRFAESRDRSRRLDLLVSIDGLAGVHDRVRGREKAFERAIATVEALAPRQEELRLRLAVNQTVADREGAADYRRLRDRLRPLGVRNQLVMAYAASATYSVDDETVVAPRTTGDFEAFGRIPVPETQALLDEAARDLAGAPRSVRIAKRYYLDGIRNRLVHGRGKPNPPCVALSSHIRMLPNGDVPTCQFNTLRAGSLRREGHRQLLKSDAARKQRKWVQACPGCWAECEVLPSALFTGAIARPPRRSPRDANVKIGTLSETLTAP